MPVQTQMQVRRGTASSWTSTNPTLAAGELGFETNTGKFKIGNGSSTWTALLYAGGGQSSLTTYQYTATAGQTTFSGADINSNTLAYTVGAIQVYLNGALLQNTVDFAASTGTSVVLTGGAGLGDSLTIISFATFDVANTIPVSAFTAKGQILAATGSGAYTAQTVGTNGQVLTANSAQADGVEWVTPSSPSFNGARGFNTTNQSLSSGVGTNVIWNAESYDTTSYHDNATNNTRFTVPAAGYYLINCQVLWSTNNTGSRILTIRKNAGADQMLKRWNGAYTNADGRTENITGILYLAASDYLVAEAYWDGTGSCSIVSNANNSYFEITFLGA